MNCILDLGGIRSLSSMDSNIFVTANLEENTTSMDTMITNSSKTPFLLLLNIHNIIQQKIYSQVILTEVKYFHS